ncbi:MAG TPA: alpha/beta fold hydrolase [Polyangiaceae bacterium]|nr:alpha/beta fold hydrolase [Polyangiaceae bacterium]
MTAPKRPRGTLMGEGSPDALVVSGRAPRLLAFHGFTGTPQEVALLVDVARELGLGAEAPLLPGHGGRVAELASQRFADWLAAAEAHYTRLAADGPVIVAGLSMGALLAFHLAKNHPKTTAGVIALSNAMWLKSPWPTLPLKLIDRLRLPDFWLSKSGPDLGDAEERARHLTYNAQPIRAAISLLRAGEALAPELHRVHAPTLLLHGALDAVAPVENAHRVAMLLGALDKRTVVFERSRHILTRDVERAAVRSEIAAFLRKIAVAD